jgi:pteridine reductase
MSSSRGSASLAGRNAIVTGAGVRIGRALALRLGEEGVNVCVHFHSSADAAGEVVESLRQAGVRAIGIEADLSHQPASAARELATAAVLALGPIDLLVNSAAVFEPGTLDGTTSESWDRHLNLNLAAPVWLAQEFARQLPAGVRGDIVNIVDWRALKPVPGHLAYTAAKSALAAVTQLLAQELAPRIRVNAIAPGAILPPPGVPASEWREGSFDAVPLATHGEPEDVSAALLYLLKSNFVTGEILHVTGGQQL